MSNLSQLLAPVAPDRSPISIPSLRKSKAIRDVPERSKGSEIGAIVCPKTNVVIQTESGNENSAVLVSFADPTVVRVKEQALRLSYTDEEGVKRKHTLDLLVEREDDFAHGLLVKPDGKAVAGDLRGFTKALASVTPTSMVDELNYVTERDMPETDIRNAGCINSVRRDRRTYVDDLLREVAPSLTDAVTIGELTDRLGGGRLAFRPVVRAIFYGTLELLTEGLIGPESYVRYSGIVMPDRDASGPVPPLRSAASLPREPKPRPSSGKRRFSYRSR